MPMQPAVVVISGIPGAGKSTIAAIVARRLERSAHIEAEVLQCFVVGDALWPARSLDVVRERNRRRPNKDVVDAWRHLDTVARRETPRLALRANVGETATTPEFGVEGDRGIYDGDRDGSARAG